MTSAFVIVGNSDAKCCKFDDSFTTVHAMRSNATGSTAVRASYLFADGTATEHNVALISFNTNSTWLTATITPPSGCIGMYFYCNSGLGTSYTLSVYFTK